MRNSFGILFCALAGVLLLLGSCGARKNLSYFKDLPDSVVLKSTIPNVSDTKIQAGDILRITVNTLNPESNVLFNSGALQTLDTRENSNINANNQLSAEGYLVDKNGNINFPVVGQIKLLGLTREEARLEMVKQLTQYVKDPIVNIRFLNFKVTVIGEVAKPSTFTIPNEKVTILEALGMAGDMTPFGKRENVLLIREENGERTMIKLDMGKKDIMNSPYFYLRQNDVVYVEPTKYKDPSGDRTLRIITAAGTSLTALALIWQRLFE
ncbi:polysaccharide export protein [Olivibacter sp. LS-1]|jgi:polysaccharide export outer membrane protein|uniref:polysaccharide biosynthesis/export family protein n=1 Tax=unclassified Olivibacter TaxID=2632301 RepID=UPI0011EA784F|nr:MULTISPECIES: polysaccharide biosynthesis/export family protein [unclassified Olivibacter]MDM8177204.1 polysaccharide biosynthesis/export family protein [Olivibacter sp. 47]QEL00362.1 polysaccharide export protein [Olivibacter sp. LS-1]